MRKGVNPAKGRKIELDSSYHRLVMPVYIPNLEGFFEESFKVLKISLESIYNTIHEKTKISVVSNGSCKQVNSFLNKELEEKRIDELLIVSAGIGKINSIFRIINNVKEPIVTLVDADVLFTSGWQEAVEKVFIDYPKVGMVCPFSYNKGYRELTANMFFYNIFNNKIKISKIKNTEPLEHFAASIGNINFYKDIHLNNGITFQEKDKSKVFIGAGHFVATFKRDVFEHYDFQPQLRKMSNGERKFIDAPAVKFGLWRVSTYKNYVYHMGNTLTPMYSILLNQNENSKAKYIDFSFKTKKASKISFYIKNILFKRILFSNYVFTKLLRRFGLNKTDAKLFLE